MVKSACNAGYLGLIPGTGSSPGERNGYQLLFSPGEFHGQRRLVGYHPWDCKESYTTEHLNTFASVNGAGKNGQPHAKERN